MDDNLFSLFGFDYVGSSFALQQYHRYRLLDGIYLKNYRGSSVLNLFDSKYNKWLLRIDSAAKSKKPNYAHFNFNSDLTKVLDPHLKLPGGNTTLKIVGTGGKMLCYFGKISLFLNIASDSVKITQSIVTKKPDVSHTILQIVRRWMGGYGGGVLGTEIGASIGGIIGSCFPVVGMAIGAGIGGWLGSIGGGVIGSYAWTYFGNQMK